MLFPLLNYSQKTWPQIQVIDADTVCIISIDQVKKINRIFIDRVECNEIKDSLNLVIDNYGILVEKKDDLLFLQDKQIEIQDNIIGKQGRIVANDSIVIRGRDKKVRWLKVQRNGLVVISVLFVILLMVR